MVLLVMVASKMVAYGGRNGRRKMHWSRCCRGCCSRCFAGEDGRAARVEGRLPVVMGLDMGG